MDQSGGLRMTGSNANGKNHVSSHRSYKTARPFVGQMARAVPVVAMALVVLEVVPFDRRVVDLDPCDDGKNPLD
jgi:hypothetical protein